MNAAAEMVVQRRTLGYHEFSNAPSKDVYELTPTAFAAHLAESIRAAQDTDAELEITFDDAHRSQIELAAPVLAEAGLHGLFFVPAAWVEVRPETMSWSALRELLAAGHSIGSHGNTHALLSRCPPDTLRQELVQSRDTLEQRLGVRVDRISAPGGRWSLHVAQACVQAGYSDLYTSEPGTTRQLSVFGPRLTVQGRLVVRRSMSAEMVARYVAQERLLSARLLAEYKIKCGIKQVLGDVGYQAIWRRLLRSPAAV